MHRQHLDAALAFSVFVIAALACGGGTNPSQRAANTPPDAIVTAEELLDAYKANEVAADERFKGKVLEVSGQIDTIGKDILDTPYVTLSAGADTFGSIQAMFSKDDLSRLSSLTKGRPITVRCRVKGKMMNILLDECGIR